jgi:predicted dienelactone hydrolase
MSNKIDGENWLFRKIVLWIATLLLSVPLFAQKRVSASREDGHETPLLVYGAAGTVTGCAPLALISHGAGGSEDGYHYLAEFLSQSGFTIVVMGHRESGLAALRADIRADGFREGVRALVADPHAEQARLLDVGAALKWADAQCKAPFLVLLGHSMGAETVMLEAGARNMISVSYPPAGQDRFDAYVALSPEGPGVVFPEHAWNGIHKPVLVLTGTRDQSLRGGPEARLIPWQDLPGDGVRKCQWMALIDGATHMNFAGNGMGASHVEPMVTRTILEFTKGVQAGACKQPATTDGMILQAK